MSEVLAWVKEQQDAPLPVRIETSSEKGGYRKVAAPKTRRRLLRGSKPSSARAHHGRGWCGG
ncbi:hypothetical protein [Pinisolibacter aquiterrae]|uniref:hypothetical protein n=1 Tax=Pinisolibacter aquiterrae TaxID=2815579 RepID=UPI001C3E4C42|nr:hypothetical protein [Pinisolibacter aquiterrae]MBV5262493.1 hypothetical protein [Pinisolibacter aquiterrae]MCC8235872.1 hypothetical protein [Pinisolibacter aquiterrae]